MISKYTSKCKVCGEMIYAGKTQISKNGSGIWAHTVCPKPVVKSDTPKPAFIPSAYQAAIRAEVERGERHIVVNATAGSGKTTTAVWCMEAMRGDVAFVAFGKEIAETLKSRVPAGAHASTFHSLGFSTNIKAVYPRIQFDKNKPYDHCQALLPIDRNAPADEKAKVRAMHGLMVKALDMARNTLTDVNDSAAVAAMCERYGINLNGDTDKLEYAEREQLQGQALGLLPALMNAMIADTSRVDHGDMVYWCAVGIVPCKKFDWLVVDECQDNNKARTAMMLNSVRPGGHVLAIGDRRQSIMGFSGADTRAMDNLIAALQSTGEVVELPLTVSYRCPRSHVELAHRIYSEIEAAPTAIDGEIITIKAEHLYKYVKVGDMVLCRVNAPLIPLAFELIRSGVKAVVRGRDIGAGLIALAEKFESNDFNSMFEAIELHRQRELNRLMRKRDNEALIDSLNDKLDTLIAIVEGVETKGQSPATIVSEIVNLFSDNIEGVVLSSAHKSKGLEAEAVYILKPELMPWPKAKTVEEQEQERNLQFVAYTRSKRLLAFVTK